MTISINMSWESVRQSLEAGRVLSAWENDEVLKQRDKEPSRGHKGDYAKRRDEVERLLSNRAKGGARDPHPIYGAAVTKNGRDEFFGGVGDARYGECFVVLKTDQVKDRTTFTYDDSFNGFSEYPLTWEDSIYAKAMLNVLEHKSMHGYVEGQVLGGVRVEDIDTVYIPDSPDNPRDIMQQTEQLKVRFPGVKFEFVRRAENV